jgi:hypothetical protein
MPSFFLQPKQLCMAGHLLYLSNRSTFRKSPAGRNATSDLSAKSGQVVCLPSCLPPLICKLLAYWSPICLKHGSLLMP